MLDLQPQKLHQLTLKYYVDLNLHMLEFQCKRKANLHSTVVSWWEMFYYLIFPQQCSQVFSPELSEPSLHYIEPFAIFHLGLWILQICPIYASQFTFLFPFWPEPWPHLQIPRFFTLMPNKHLISEPHPFYSLFCRTTSLWFALMQPQLLTCLGPGNSSTVTTSLVLPG